MVDCLRALGIAVEVSAAGVSVAGTSGTSEGTAGNVTMTVTGCAGRPPATGARLDARQSGTTARFVAPVAALGHGRVVLDADPQMRARPMGPTFAALAALGADVATAEGGRLPATIQAGGLRGGPLRLPADESSQFASGLLLAAPAMRDGLELSLATDPVSQPYLAMTVEVLRAFGAHVEVLDGGRRYVVAPGPLRARAWAIEPDASAASYAFAAAAVTGGRVRVAGLGRASLQGDLSFVDVLARMGCTVSQGDDWTEVRGPAPGGLRGVDVDLADLSDTAPTFAVVAALADGPSRATGIGFIRRKESDRIAAVVTELRRLGVDADEEADGFAVRPAPAGPHGAVVQTYRDHRMAMSLALVGLRVPGVAVADPGCVAKTFPGFWALLERLRGRAVA
jgi:3-phosphoshikimate 1-carboxyvinyltransferase